METIPRCSRRVRKGWTDMVEAFLKQVIGDFKPYHATKGMTYEDGLLLIAAIRFFEVTGDPVYRDFLYRYMEAHIDDKGQIFHYSLEEYNIDNILAGNALFFLWDDSKDPRYINTLALLRSQLQTHPRTASGSFWHKLRYPNQIWLDGLYMGQVFYLRYALKFEEEGIAEDVLRQVENARKFLWDEKKQLYLHAYDETKSMQWADPVTGRSPNVWSRSVGWFAMALADLAESFAAIDESAAARMGALLKELVEGMLPHRDPVHKMWYQLVEKPELPGNYLETSGTAMMVYAILKGVRLGWLPAGMKKEALLTLRGLESRYLVEENGRRYLGGICQVAGLDNERRDGSDAYYLSEKISVNEIKGLGPYFFCYAEWMLQEQTIQ